MVAIQTKSNIPQPKLLPKLGWFIYLLATAAMIGGFLYGYNSGAVSPAMMYLPKNKDMQPMGDFWKEIITAITPGMAGVGALPAGLASDIFGRKKIIILSSLIYTLGGILSAISFAKWFLLIGRILIGLGLGISSMTVPIYVSEASPVHIRGRLLTCYQLLLGFGIVAGNTIGGAFSYVNPTDIGWRLILGFAAIPSIIQCIAFLFLPESPRYLYKRGQSFEVESILRRIYNGDKDWVKYELEEIQISHDRRQKAKAKVENRGFILWQILKTQHVRKALLIGCSLQAFQQLAGINAILYYASQIIKADGVSDDHTAIWISVATSAMNLITCVVPMFLVERVGRRMILLISVSGSCISLLLLGAGFLAMSKESALVNMTIPHDGSFNMSVKHWEKCRQFANCDSCVTNEHCGFCTIRGAKNGYCLPVNKGNNDKEPSTGYCNFDIQHKFHIPKKYIWSSDYCETKFTAVILVFIFVYLAFFGAGYAPLPWVFNSEFYPLWARGTCVSITTFTHWIFNLIVTLTFLSLKEAITNYGVFFLYGTITFVGLVIYIIWVPETKGLSTEEIEKLFISKTSTKKNQNSDEL